MTTPATTPADEEMRRCQQCNAPRKGAACHKCGSPTVEPCAGWEEPALPPIDRIRELKSAMPSAYTARRSATLT